MLLRASGKVTGDAFDVHVITEGGTAAPSGVPHGEMLIAFAEAMVGDDEAILATARQRVLIALGSEALVDAAAVVSNFERMVRIADSTGIPLDDVVYEKTVDVREELHLGRFRSAANTPKA